MAALAAAAAAGNGAAAAAAAANISGGIGGSTGPPGQQQNVYEIAALTQELDTLQLTTRVRELLSSSNICQKVIQLRFLLSFDLAFEQLGK